MNRHTWGTLGLGLSITAIVTVALYLLGLEQLAVLAAAFFGTITGMATVTDHVEQLDRMIEEEHVSSALANLNGEAQVMGLDEVPEEVKAILEQMMRDAGVENVPDGVGVVRVRVRRVEDEPQSFSELTPEELAEIEEKWS